MDSKTPMTALTEEQQKIVAHNHGPALVFAVAGAGKTTAMVHRIERLIRDKIFTPRTILATSFSKASVADIKLALAQWPHCAGVQVSTLHSVGWGIMRLAQRRGHLTEMDLCNTDDENTESHVLTRALANAWREKVWYSQELETLDRQDFQNYVSVMKANLLYADFAKADLPTSARQIAGQAPPAPAGFGWYLDLYKLYERIRREENLITFDDMLMTGWECLVRFPDVLQEIRNKTQCVLVDEFQDVNLVQSEILDLLTSPHRNYMAIGDDDQTIYEWRGADPGFILTFAERYKAQKYFISDNFRSKAPHLALANRVIERNLRREPKRLSLTQGFDGGVYVHHEPSSEQMGQHIAKEIKAYLRDGYAPSDISILVRLYAQTPYIEQALIGEHIPYRVIGSGPFYQRGEVLGLIDYLRLAQYERDLQNGQRLDMEQIADLTRRWNRVANKPTRYISKVVSEAVCRAVSVHQVPISKAIARVAGDVTSRIAENMIGFAGILTWLATTLDRLTAHATLVELEPRLGYIDYLRRSSGFPETGEAKAASILAFIKYTMERGTPTELLEHLDEMAAQQIGRNSADTSEMISLMTVFRAKGLQWPIVFVPDVNQGTFPYGGPDELEEERRLFYVAITRPKQDLHLHVIKTERPSQFMIEADWEQTLASAQSVKESLSRDPSQWRTQDALALARHTSPLNLERYFHTWWDVAPERASQIAQRVQSLLNVAASRGVSESLRVPGVEGVVWQMFGISEIEDADEVYSDLEDFIPKPTEETAPHNGSYQIGDWVNHPQHGVGRILSIVGERSPRLEIQFDKGKPIVLLAKFVNMERV